MHSGTDWDKQVDLGTIYLFCEGASPYKFVLFGNFYQESFSYEVVRQSLPPALCSVFASAKKLVTAVFIVKTLRILKLEIKYLKMLIQINRPNKTKTYPAILQV